MMTQPSVKELMTKLHEGDSRYTLVIATAKRARQITNGFTTFSTAESNKPVSIAAKEISEGKIIYYNNEQAAKLNPDFGEDAISIDEDILIDEELPEVTE